MMTACDMQHNNCITNYYFNLTIPGMYSYNVIKREDISIDGYTYIAI